MKTLYTSFIALFLTFTLNAQIVDIPDVNFKYALVNSNCVDTDGDGTADSVVDLNTDGEIQVSEAEAVTNLIVRYDLIDSLEGIEAFTNLQVLDVTGNHLVTLDISSLTNLIDLNCSYNDFTSLDFGSNPSLTTLNCSGNYLTSLLGIEAFTNLQVLNVRSNNLTVLDNSLLTNIIDLDCGSNDFTALDFGSLPNLTTLNCRANDLSSLNVSGLTNLINLRCDYITLSSLDLSALTNLQNLDCRNNQLTTLDLSALVNLQVLNCNYNQLTALDVNTLTNLTDLHCRENQISSLDVSALTNLTILDCTSNQLTALDVSALTNLTSLNCGSNQLTALDVSTLTNLAGLSCGSNQLTELDLSMLTDITWLWCESNQITELDVSALPNLDTFNCGDNLLTELDVTNNPLMSAFYCNDNQITFIDLSNKVVSTFDLILSNNLIETLIIKNGHDNDLDPDDLSFSAVSFSNNPLTYVCADENEIELVNTMLDFSSISDCAVSSYCSFVPGGEYFTVEGNTRIDLDIDGCDMADTIVPYLNFEITDGTETGNFISNGTGNYNIPVPEGSHTITPVLENPDYFTVAPTEITVSFPTDTSPHMQDFCVTPNAVFNDLEITIIPVELARPGFDVDYRVIYKNKGNTTLSGNINFGFEDDVMDFVTSTPANESGVPDLLQWSFIDFIPFESREINLTMNLNAPTDTPSLNDGDILSFNASIASSETDETPDDNMFELNQNVVNSFDPNDKTCLEGDYITPEMVGDYVHYMIRFENTGTAGAVNIVVKDHIDITKYDLPSLIPLHASHDFFARIKNTTPDHYVEFIFENINLPFDDANNDGYVVFKIRTLDTLVLDDTIENEAEIYFDFNFPIITNVAQTTIATLSVDDIEFDANISMYPNPVQNELFINANNNIEQIRIYDLSGRMIREKSMIGSQRRTSISTEKLSSSVYFISVKTTQGKFTKRIVKD